MSELSQEVVDTFGNRLRVRCCGLLFQENKLLLIRHRMGKERYLWTPPGGGMLFGETAEECLKREFKEECGLEVDVCRFLFVHELLLPPLHGVELFFEVSAPRYSTENLKVGYDPEVKSPLIDRLAFFDHEALSRLPSQEKHPLFRRFPMQTLIDLQGYFLTSS
jgi:ADP-ribose pyrophosphatase YjhB (NUDIX family)